MATMTKKEATAFAKELDKRDPEFTHEPRHQYWREGHHWYVRRSDGAGVFKGENA